MLNNSGCYNNYSLGVLKQVLVQVESVDSLLFDSPSLNHTQNLNQKFSDYSSTNFCSVNFFLGVIVTAIVFLSILIKYLWTPYDLYKEYTDYVSDKPEKRAAFKRQMINEMQARKKEGSQSLPPIYPNGWFVLLESDKVKKGQAKEVSVLGMDLVVWRGAESGTAYVANAYCPHLGAHLGAGGKVDGECISCPFHGWKFCGKDEGRLKKIPYADSKPNGVQLGMKRSLERNGFIYIWYHAEGEEPSWFPKMVPQIEKGEWLYRGRCEFLVKGHIQEVLENLSDWSHFSVLHETVPLPLIGYRPSLAKFLYKITWTPQSEKGQTHTAIVNSDLKIQFFKRWTPDFGNNKTQSIQQGPGLVDSQINTQMGNGVMFMNFTPIGPLLLQGIFRIYVEPKMIQPIASLSLFVATETFTQDLEVFHRKIYPGNPVLTKDDVSIKSFRRWYAQFYSANSPRSPSIKENLDF